jgi:hypothetical protein
MDQALSAGPEGGVLWCCCRRVTSVQQYWAAAVDSSDGRLESMSAPLNQSFSDPCIVAGQRVFTVPALKVLVVVYRGLQHYRGKERTERPVRLFR